MLPDASEFLNLHSQIKILGLLTALGLIPFVLIMMTSFTRITIIFHFLKQALGTQQVPSSQLTTGLSLILTAFVMHGVIDDIQTNALKPYMNGDFKTQAGVMMEQQGEDFIFLERCWKPLRNFMSERTRDADLSLFVDISGYKVPLKTDAKDVTVQVPDMEAIPWYIVVPSFVCSELRVAFMMGFLLFMPFLVIDMVVSSVLMAMGMMMLPPVMISVPFKLLLFIVVDGWRLVIQQTVTGCFPHAG